MSQRLKSKKKGKIKENKDGGKESVEEEKVKSKEK